MILAVERRQTAGGSRAALWRLRFTVVEGVLLATDSDAVFNEVDAALASNDTPVYRVVAGAHVLEATIELDPALVLLDLQIGNMGGVAATLALKQEEGMDRLEHRPVGLLLDRAADTFIASESGADGWLIKPLDPLRLQRFAASLLASQGFYEGVSAEV